MWYKNEKQSTRLMIISFFAVRSLMYNIGTSYILLLCMSLRIKLFHDTYRHSLRMGDQSLHTKRVQ